MRRGLLAAASACGDDDDAARSEPAATDAGPRRRPPRPSSRRAVERLTGERRRRRAAAEAERRADQGRAARRRSPARRPPDSGPSTRSAAAWETWVNENGGIAGQPVEVVFKDSANDAAKTQAAAKELVEQDEVIAVVLADGTTEDAIGPYLNEQRMPVVGGFGFSSNVWGKLDNFFTLKTDVMAIVAGPILAADVVGATTFGGGRVLGEPVVRAGRAALPVADPVDRDRATRGWPRRRSRSRATPPNASR